MVGASIAVLELMGYGLDVNKGNDICCIGLDNQIKTLSDDILNERIDSGHG